MKKTIIFIAITLLLNATSCKDDSPSSPDNDQDDIITTETIGTAGGSISSAEVTITIPANSFASEQEISISESNANDFETGGISTPYKIEGIPADYNLLINLSLKLDSETNEDVFVAVGAETFIKSSFTSATTYYQLDAIVSDGAATCQLPVPEGLLSKIVDRNTNTNETFDLLVQVITGKTYTSSDGHFKINYLVGVSDQSVNLLAGYLEDAYEKFIDLGFSYSVRTKWPVEVTVRSINDEDFGHSVSSIWGDNYSYLEFNSRKIYNAPEMRLTAGHEFFHLVQSFYDPRNRFSKAKFASQHLWIDEASAVWSEQFFTNEQNYVSPIREGHTSAFMRGMQTGPGTNAQSYGYGMSALIKYFGEESVIKIYNSIKAGSHPIEAVNFGTIDPASYWWTDFTKKYINGDIYDDISPLTLATDTDTKIFEINSDGDSIKVFDETYSDLSVMLFNVKLNNPLFTENSVIRFNLTPNSNQTLLVFKYKGSSIEFIDQSDSELQLNNVKDLYDSGWFLLAAVPNFRWLTPYTGTTNVSLTVRSSKSETIDLSKYKYCQIGLYNADFYMESSNGDQYYVTIGHLIPLTKVEGSFQGNTFTAEWDISEYPARNGQLTVTLNDDLLVTSFSASEIIDDNASITTKSLQGKNVQLQYYQNNPPNTLSGELRGINNIVTEGLNVGYRIDSQTSGYWTQITSVGYSDESVLVIVFKEY